MAFDFQSAVAAATAVAEKQSQQGGSNYKYPLVYPQAGQTITVKPLFNPASGQILRLVNRHEKIACYRTYGVDCPICQIQQQVKDKTGQDPFGRTKKSVSRGICFAQYVSSSYQIEKSNSQGVLQAGDIILFMFPWSVYTQINAVIQAISQTPTGMDQAFCHSQTGLFVQVNVTADFKYTTNSVPYMTIPSSLSDDDFIKMLEGMESLYEQVLPSTITEEVDKQVKEYADTIYRQYILPSTPPAAVPTPAIMPTPVPLTSVPITTTYPPQGTSSLTVSTQGTYVVPPATGTAPAIPGAASPSGTPAEGTKPSCFGHHTVEPRCICCPDEMNCISSSSPF